MKKTIIIILILAVLGTAGYFAWKKFKKPSDETNG